MGSLQLRIIRTDKQDDYCKSGIHLYKPSKREIENAKEDAISKDFTVIYIHRENSSPLEVKSP